MFDGTLHYIPIPDDLVSTSFLWEKRPLEAATGLSEIARIKTYHTFGYIGLFKPSVREVMVCIPEDLLDKVVAYETLTPALDQLDPKCLKKDIHNATTILYGRTSESASESVTAP